MHMFQFVRLCEDKRKHQTFLTKDLTFYVTVFTWFDASLLVNCQDVRQLMHKTLIFNVQVPVAYISSLIDFFQTFLRLFFFIIFGFIFSVNSVFFQNRVATLVTISEQKISWIFWVGFWDPEWSHVIKNTALALEPCLQKQSSGAGTCHFYKSFTALVQTAGF